MIRAAFIAAVLLLGACGDNRGAVFLGYVEGEFVGVAPELGGRIVTLEVRRGDPVEADDLLFALEDSEAAAEVAQAEAELARAEAQLRNLQQGQRPPEIAVIQAQIAEAQAQLEQARREFERQQALFERRVISQARLDQARETVRVAEARVAAAQRQREVAELPARTPEIEAAERSVEAAQAALKQATTRLAKHVVYAPAAGRVEDVHYELGEVVTVGAPVVAMLPSGKRKIIFFVPEPARPELVIGSTLSIACDGCPPDLTARLTYLGQEAEYTPPVIFSRKARAKLMFRAEAALTGAAADSLPLGQPVEMTSALRGAQ
jgi:HlyD family secretion protein